MHESRDFIYKIYYYKQLFEIKNRYTCRIILTYLRAFGFLVLLSGAITNSFYAISFLCPLPFFTTLTFRVKESSKPLPTGYSF